MTVLVMSTIHDTGVRKERGVGGLCKVSREQVARGELEAFSRNYKSGRLHSVSARAPPFPEAPPFWLNCNNF